ncbi:MAG TPA: hypothetical protein VFS60_08915 [Thermoanaerobaculia bacterium]|nr:hypothetical protein [Thermoanaerobaculia bacterium]
MRIGVFAATAGALLLVAAADLHGAERPSYAIGRDRTLSVSALPEVLSRPEVHPHLTTGLTTSFMVVVKASAEPGRKARGAARIDVRWEPWDEVFFTAAMGADGQVRRHTHRSFEALTAWWQSLELPVTLALPVGSWEVKVELSVLPFSQTEQRDAQSWFLNAPADPAPRPSAEGRAESRLDGVVDLLIATSIQRRSIVRYAWPALQRPPAARAP